MRPKEVLDFLAVCQSANLAPNLQGPPGCAKTALVRKFAESIGYSILVLDLPKIYDPVDYRGIPANINGRTTWLPPDYLTVAEQPTVVFVDDYGTCPPTSQAALMGLFLNRELGGHPLPPETFVVAAGNRVRDASAVYATPAALRNRMVWATVSVHLEDWTEWALVAGVHHAIIAFHRFTSGRWLYPTYNGTDATSECGICDRHLEPWELCSACLRRYEAFPSPRSWEFASRMLIHMPPNAPVLEPISGAIGMPVAVEFAGYLAMYRELPTVETILASPSAAPLPSGPAQMYAVCLALSRNLRDDTVHAISTYGRRLPREFQVMLLKDSSTCNPKIAGNPVWLRWFSEHQDLML